MTRKDPSQASRGGDAAKRFSKPVIYKKEEELDLDSAMADFFTEIGGAPEEPAPPAEEAPQAPIEPPPVVEAPAAPASSTPSGIPSDGNFMAMFLAMQQGQGAQEPAPAPAAPEEASPSKAAESAPKKRSLKEIQEARKAARKKAEDAEEAPPPSPAAAVAPPPPKEAKPPPPAEDLSAKPKANFNEPMLWPGERPTDDEDSKKAKKEPEAWEFMKPDEFGTGNFFSFDSF